MPPSYPPISTLGNQILERKEKTSWWANVCSYTRHTVNFEGTEHSLDEQSVR